MATVSFYGLVYTGLYCRHRSAVSAQADPLRAASYDKVLLLSPPLPSSRLSPLRSSLSPKRMLQLSQLLL